MLKNLHVGEKFGRWTILKYLEERGNYQYVWCRCDCGTERAVQLSWLVYGKGDNKSCGCWRSDRLTVHGRRRRGKDVIPEYGVWEAMKRRCYWKKDPAYLRYGGRGIYMCESWRTNFENFYQDMGPRPEGAERYTIERKNNDGPYSPENCKWATYTEQGNNKRNNRRFSYDGRNLTLPEWSRETGISRLAIWKRLHRGWSIHKALTVKSQN